MQSGTQEVVRSQGQVTRCLAPYPQERSERLIAVVETAQGLKGDPAADNADNLVLSFEEDPCAWS